eukprot:Nitzschia sp. Nitz4//scaffold115_size69933//43370//44929//NITZ4_006007-RA/size69933-processed-gene-0.70-mRNA-1//-1//CDS//3329533514//3380//frame0
MQRGISTASLSSALIQSTTEGWLELFLTTPEKHRFGEWKEDIRDSSLSSFLVQPLVRAVVPWIPVTVAPNLLTSAAFATIGQAWYLTYQYGDEYPTACTWVAVVAILLFGSLSFVSNAHADRIRQRTALGELFKYNCDCASTVFLSLLTCYSLGGTDVETQWYVVQIAQLVLYWKHLSAFSRNAGLRYSVFTGPGEVLTVAVWALAIRATVGLEPFWRLILWVVQWDRLVDLAGNPTGAPREMGHDAIVVLYYTAYTVVVTRTLLLKAPHGWSRFGLSASLLMRLLPALLLRVSSKVQVADVISDGLFMAVLTSDITLAKMAGREVHPWVVLMSFAATLHHSTILGLVAVYYIAVFGDLCAYLNMPLLTTCRNVYCDGIYDLCHIGHKNLFRNALTYGNRLYVGVIGDKDAQQYKRPPIMTAAERCAEVEACKSVTKVIPDAPCFGLTREFLDLHQIHVVAYGAEYMERYPDPKDDPYYRVPRELGMARPLPRTEGLSTSDLIRRIQKARPADEKKSPT